MRLISWLCETISNCNYQKPGCSIISHSLAEHKQKFIVTLYFFCHYVCVTPSSLTTETQQNADAFKFHCTDIDLVTSNHFQSLSRWREVKFEKKKKKKEGQDHELQKGLCHPQSCGFVDFQPWLTHWRGKASQRSSGLDRVMCHFLIICFYSWSVHGWDEKPMEDNGMGPMVAPWQQKMCMTICSGKPAFHGHRLRVSEEQEDKLDIQPCLWATWGSLSCSATDNVLFF